MLLDLEGETGAPRVTPKSMSRICKLCIHLQGGNSNEAPNSRGVGQICYAISLCSPQECKYTTHEAALSPTEFFGPLGGFFWKVLWFKFIQPKITSLVWSASLLFRSTIYYSDISLHLQFGNQRGCRMLIWDKKKKKSAHANFLIVFFMQLGGKKPGNIAEVNCRQVMS